MPVRTPCPTAPSAAERVRLKKMAYGRLRRPLQRHGTAVPVEVHHLRPGRSAGRARPAFEPPLDWRELAFYDAVAGHGTARSVMGDEVLAGIAREPVAEVRSKRKPDWIAREPVRARLRSAIKRLLAHHHYPPDQAPEAVNLVLKQMEHFANEWSTTGVPE